VAPRYIADTSAIARMRSEAVSERLAPIIESGDVATCSVVELEVLYNTRNVTDLRATRQRRRSLPFAPMKQADFDRAADVMEALAARGQHRSVGLPDLLIAACAERSALTILHYDSDFDAIASVTSQPTDWVVPRGSVP
jgi:predicted nucleic acid-binding protein